MAALDTPKNFAIEVNVSPRLTGYAIEGTVVVAAGATVVEVGFLLARSDFVLCRVGFSQAAKPTTTPIATKRTSVCLLSKRPPCSS
jgi:hypothetical protein